SIVFMPPVLSATRYSGALDIVMADPYPIPDSPITLPGSAARQLRNEFNGKKPVWIVPQAFGGGELWSREPTIQEVRSMTYQAIINGARGIQYFVREGLNLFPKSVATWSECGRMSLEIAAITPWLLSDEEPFGVQSDSRNIQAASALHDDQLIVMAVNISNAPQKSAIRIEGFRNGRARVLFENRTVPVSMGIISDHLPAYGSQVYLIDLRRNRDDVKPYPGNLIRDPGFEDISSPGVPAACYAWNMGDRGATYFVDPGEHYEGGHSLRMQTPEDNKSVRLRFFPFNVKQGRTYIISVWVKSDPEQRPSPVSMPQEKKGSQAFAKHQYFELSLGNFGSKRFIPDHEWKQYVMSVKVPIGDEVPSRLNLLLSMPGAGVAWFDMLQVFEAVDLGRSVNPELRSEE
ncbi:MAG: carbohydrate binding domain-containing protein, partial [Bacteroidales bacterium]|nr:carbohydrate binding domain-containing protein [Bacteroidales bacterium]